MLTVVFDGVVYSSWLFLMAAGLTLIYGVMRILNIAHGSLYAIGAYAAASLGAAWVASGHAAWEGRARPVRACGRAGDGTADRARPSQVDVREGRDRASAHHLRPFLILEDAIKLVWGVESKMFSEPYALLGNFQLGGMAYPAYNLVLIAVAV